MPFRKQTIVFCDRTDLFNVVNDLFFFQFLYRYAFLFGRLASGFEAIILLLVKCSYTDTTSLLFYLADLSACCQTPAYLCKLTQMS